MNILERTEQYFASTRWNQSKLKELNKSLYKYLAYMKKQKERANSFVTDQVHNRLGSAADLLLCGGAKAFDQVYHVAAKQENAPSAAAQNVMHYAKKAILELEDPSHKWHTLGGSTTNAFLYMLSPDLNKLWEEAMDHANKDGKYYGHVKDWTKRKNKIKAFEAYWVELWEAQGKEILSASEMGTISKIKQSFLDWPEYTQYLDTSRYKMLTQYPIYFSMQGQQLKVLLDFLILDMQTRKVYIRDLKSTSKPFSSFFYQIFDYGYDFQAATYSLAVLDLIKQKNEKLGEGELQWEFGGYALWVESTISPANPSPMMVEIPKEVLNEASTKLVSALNKLEWYQQTDFQVDYDKARMCKYGITLNPDGDGYKIRTDISQ